MQEQKILTAKNLALKPNPVLKDPNKPFLYQKRASLLMLLRPNMVLGDDVGLGKTYELLTTFSYLKSANPETKMLVLTERNAFRGWTKEIAENLLGLKVRVINATTHTAKQRATAFAEHGVDIVITGYGSLYDYTEFIAIGMGPRWIAVADEPNYFKNPESLLHKNVYGLFVGDLEGKPFRVWQQKDEEGKRVESFRHIQGVRPVRTYGLTATVVENRLEEAFGIFRVCAPGCFPSKKQFEDDYCVMKKVPRKRIRTVVGYKNLKAFRKQIEPYFYGRLQTDPEVMQDLPEAIPKDLEIEMGPEQSRKVLDSMDRCIETAAGELKQLDILSSLTMSQQLVNDPGLQGFDIKSPKTEALIEMLTNSLAQERVLIHSKFRTMIDRLEQDLDQAGIEVVRVTGAEDDRQREVSQARFMSDGPDKCRVILVTKAGARAMNLQRGGHLFFYDLPWSYGVYRQIIGRLKRTGSAYTQIGVYRMLAVMDPGIAKFCASDQTIDHYTLETIKKKYKLWQAITGDADEIDGVSDMLPDIMEAIKTGYKRAA